MTLPTLSRSLSARLLVLTAFFVMLAEVLIFAPSVARFRRDHLQERLAAAHLAALAVEAAPEGMVTAELNDKLLANVGAHVVDVSYPGGHMYMLASRTPPPVDEVVDLRDAGFFELIADAFATLFQAEPRVLHVMGASPKYPSVLVEAVIDEAPMRAAMLDFGARILGLSIFISAITAGLVFLSLHRLMVRPLRRLTESMVAFRRDPEDDRNTIVPSRRRDEIGVAERELLDMQTTVRTSLRQRERLAALGTAVTKINHDLRNILSTATVVSERLSASDDPEVRRVTPRLMAALDRAIDLCSQTLSYSREGTMPLRRSRFELRDLVEDVMAEVAAPDRRAVEWTCAVPPDLAIEADREQLARALANLGRNAVEAGATRVRVEAEGRGDRVVVTVADDGHGLPPRARENLFQPFAGSARAGGTGLGLAIAREVIRAHRGDVRLVSSTGEGTVFAIELPAEVGARAERADQI